MNISLPESLKSFVDERVKSCGYGSHSEYLRDLVRRDEREAAKDALRALLMEGLNSAHGRPWQDVKAELRKRTYILFYIERDEYLDALRLLHQHSDLPAQLG